MTTIRRMRLAEAPVLRELTKEGVARLAARYPEDRIGISEAGLDNLETHYRVGAAHPDLITLVAEDGGEIVGFVDAEITRDRTLPGVSGEIGDLWVREEAGAEAAEALVREAARELRDRGAGAIFHTEDADHPEREPWESLGFRGDVVRFSLYDD
jgi:ribosomal protein S18 acetylase RimI-like enzyme